MKNLILMRFKYPLKKLIKKIDEGEYTAREIVMAGTILFLSGILLGFIFSPKKTTTIGSHNGNNNTGTLVSDEDKKEGCE